MKTLKDLKALDIDKAAKAIEAEAGQALACLRESLSEAKAGKFSEIHPPAQIMTRRRGRPVGSKQAVTKEAGKVES